MHLTAIEFDADASAACAARLAPPSRAVAAKVEDVLADALPADVVLLNPPRTGVDAAVTAALAAVEPKPRAIIYVSCDPATLARDVSRLPGWRVALVSADRALETQAKLKFTELVRFSNGGIKVRLIATPPAGG